MERFEIATGAILTQNTSFTSVTESLIRLQRLRDRLGLNDSRGYRGFTPKDFLKLPIKKIISAITPARYPNRKAEYLITLAEFFIKLKQEIPKREDLLSLRGVGEETADTILLYGFGQAEFVIDAYTKRILSAVNHPPKNYQEAKMIFEKSLLPAFPDFAERVRVYQEYHALLVEHAKYYYSRKIDGEYGRNASKNKCFLQNLK